MPINKSNIIFIGNAGGICGYLSHGVNIVRKSSSLTAQRVAEEPAFEGFRKSGNRMKQASPISSSLYKLLPKDQKEFALYRILTGEALKMIKLGLETEVILTKLKEQFIDPILENLSAIKNPPQKDRANKSKSRYGRNSNLSSGDLFKTFTHKGRDKRNLLTNRILQYAERPAEQIGLTEQRDSNEVTLPQQRAANIAIQLKEMKPKQKRVSRFSEFIYMGRLKECKGLKMWLRP